MKTRKVQRLGPSTLAMTLPAEWASAQNVEKGDEVSLRMGSNGTLTVLPESAHAEETEAVVHSDELDANAVERAIVAQYALGRRVIHVEREDGALDSDIINAVYRAETQLMGLGVIEETPESIAIRCSVDPADFTLDNLLTRLERTGRTMRGEAIKALAHGNPDLAERALNRERQANKIFVLILRLIFSAHGNPAVAQSVGLDGGVSLIGYRSIAKNLELTADNAEDVADIVVGTEGHTLDVENTVMADVRALNDEVDEITTLAVEAAVNREYDLAIDARTSFAEISAHEREILTSLPEMANEDLLQIREVLVSLEQTAQYAVRNAEIAANLSLNEESAHTTIS